jgi:hypothetical protein
VLLEIFEEFCMLDWFKLFVLLIEELESLVVFYVLVEDELVNVLFEELVRFWVLELELF